MDMETGNRDKAIAAAIAALPYRRPSAAFRARVMAAVRAEAAAARLAWALKCFAAVTGLWAALVAFFAAGPLLRLAVEYAPLVAGPGGPAAALRLLLAGAAELAGRWSWLLSAAGDLAAAAAGALPPAHEVAIAAALLVLLMRKAPAAAAQRI